MSLKKAFGKLRKAAEETEPGTRERRIVCTAISFVQLLQFIKQTGANIDLLPKPKRKHVMRPRKGESPAQLDTPAKAKTRVRTIIADEVFQVVD